MNLPNSITVGRIAASPLVALLPFADSWGLRLAGFALFLVVAISDYYDGMLARSRNLVTDLGRVLDPLADKLFLLATFVPMYLLMARRPRGGLSYDGEAFAAAFARADFFPFVTPWEIVPLPVWAVAIILGRELFMTVFRQLAVRRGVVIAAIGPAKWKTGFQLTWVGAAYFWFFAASAAARYGWTSPLWRAFAYFNGLVGVFTMAVALFLTLYSLALYLRRYGGVFVGRRDNAGAR
jgi:phosphatidylglycerophosphate synthase